MELNELRRVAKYEMALKEPTWALKNPKLVVAFCDVADVLKEAMKALSNLTDAGGGEHWCDCKKVKRRSGGYVTLCQYCRARNVEVAAYAALKYLNDAGIETT